LSTSSNASSLERIAESIRGCRGCPLFHTRTKPVPGEGSPSWIMFIGEAPGREEDREGRPFVGSAGRFLDELLATAGLERGSIFITNVVKCRPPSNRMPTVREIDACKEHLQNQIGVIGPRLIVTLGGVALKSVLGLTGIKSLRGRPILREGIVYLPLLHPAASLYDPKLKEVLMEDFRLLGSLIEAGPEGVKSRMGPARGLKTLDRFAD